MVKSGNIDFQEISEIIKKKFLPEKIILFGSHVYGNTSENSDVDLLVIIKTDIPPRKMAIKIRKELNREIPFDIIVRTPEQVNKRLEMQDFFISQILNHGIAL